MSLSEHLDSRRALARFGAIALVLGLGIGACSDDDGADVRASGPGACDASGSGSGTSASGSASGGSASGSCPSASGSGSGSEAEAACEAVDGTTGVDDAAVTVGATLDEYSIELDVTEAAAGKVGFSAENAGDEDHEIVIARVTPDEISVVDGAPDEEALGDRFIGEIEAFGAGGTCEGTFELTAGDYTLFCAIVDEMGHSHYEEGMVTTLTVG